MKKLKIKTLANNWQESDTMILHACFQILIDYVEKQKPREVIDWDASPGHKKAWSEIDSLYKWWTIEWPALAEKMDNEDDVSKWGDYEKALLEEEEANLHRLINIMGHLWT